MSPDLRPEVRGLILARMYPIPVLFALHAGGPFVGRSAQLAALLARRFPAMLVTGEAGVGKTRLVAEAVTAAAIPVVVAHCDDLREPQPLGPVLDGLRAARTAGVVDPQRLRGHRTLGVLAPLLPQLAD